MTDTTDNLQLPWLAAAQAQKHVTLNASLQALDAVVQLAVASRVHATPPSTPVAGERHIVAAGASGAWAGQAGAVAAFQDGVWTFYTPREGWSAWVADEHLPYVFTAGAWTPGASGAGAAVWGVNTQADTHNRLAVASDAVLLTHAAADHRLTVDKASPAATASLIFSTGFSGRAEIGLPGTDDLVVKVSPDGATWREALHIACADGGVAFPAGGVPGAPNLLINGDFRINQRGFGGGALAAGAYGFDRWKAGGSGCTCSLSSSRLALSAGALVQVVEPSVWGEDGFAGATLSFSVDGLAGGSLQVSAGSASATVSPSVPSARLALQSGDQGALSLAVAVASGAPIFRRLKLEVGGHATPWTARSASEELRLCQRYFEASAPAGSAPAGYAPGAPYGSIYTSADPSLGSATPVRFLTPKRITPTLTIRDGAATAGRISTYTGANGWRAGIVFTGVQAPTDKGFALQQNNSGVIAVSFDWTAEAEF